MKFDDVPARSPLQVQHDELMARQQKEIAHISDLRRLGLDDEADEHVRRFKEVTTSSARRRPDQTSCLVLDAMRAAIRRKPGGV